MTNRASFVMFIFLFLMAGWGFNDYVLADELIDFEIINRNELGSIKVSYDIRVNLVNNRLPNVDELKQISQYIHDNEKKHERTFICYYLPDMEVGSGAFATGHYNPALKIVILEFMIPTKYKHLIMKQ